MQLSEKSKTYFQFVIAFLESALSFLKVSKQNKPHSLSISKVIDSEKHAYLFLKRLRL